jgi:hypothetical protein
LFDETGTILDQSGVSGSQVRYGYAAKNGNAREGIAATNSIFCDTCVNNQNVVLSILQSRDDDEEDLAILKEDLERRYPPVCKDCEPNVIYCLSEQQQKYKAGILLSPKRKDSIIDLKTRGSTATKKWLPWFIIRVVWIIALVVTVLGIVEPFSQELEMRYLLIPYSLQVLGMFGLISLHFFDPGRSAHNIFAHQAQPTLWIPILFIATLLWSLYVRSATIRRSIASILLLRSCHRFFKHYMKPILKRNPIISTLQLDSCPVPKSGAPERKDNKLTQENIQQSIDALSLSKQERPRKSNSIWSAGSTHTVPWHAKERSLPPIPVPELRLDSNPNSIHWNMFKKSAFGQKVYPTVEPTDPQANIAQPTMNVHFRPQRFFPKQVLPSNVRKILVWKICSGRSNWMNPRDQNDDGLVNTRTKRYEK